MTTAGGAVVAVGAGPPPAGEAIIASGDLVMPGLVSAHQHVVDLLVAGGPTGPTFLDWLLGTYHAGLAHAGPDDCALAIAAVRAATLAAGVTTMVDCWSVGPVDDPSRNADCADASIAAHLSSGGRTLFGVMFNEVAPASWRAASPAIDPARLCAPADRSLAEVERIAAVARTAEDASRLTVAPAPELPDTMSTAGLQEAFALAGRFGTVMPLHLCASPPARAAYGPDELERDGLASPRLLGAHVSAVDHDDVTRLGAAGIGVAHCPTSARALGSTQLTPLAALRRAGARAGIGLDNASLNPGRDLFAEARQAGLAAITTGDPVTGEDLFRMVTTEAAEAVGMGDQVGTIAAGRRADLLVVDTSGPHWWPRLSSWPETVMACARADDVDTVLVDGRVVAVDGVSGQGFDGTALDRAAARIRVARGW